MSRRLRNLFVAVTTIFLVIAMVWFWLLHTAHGSRFIWSVVEQRLPGELSIAVMEGDLSGGLHMKSVQFTNDLTARLKSLPVAESQPIPHNLEHVSEMVM